MRRDREIVKNPQHSQTLHDFLGQDGSTVLIREKLITGFRPQSKKHSWLNIRY